jgi:hypothetical protein
MPRPEPLHAGPYWYREPLALPPGTVVRVFAETGAKAWLLLEPGP